MSFRFEQRRKRGRTACCTLVLLALFGSTSLGQSIWEVTPYTGNVIWTVGNQPDIPASWRSEFAPQLERDLKLIFQATWHAKVDSAPEALRVPLLQNIEHLTAKDLYEANPEWTKVDKLFLVAISGSRRGYEITVREFDGALAHFGPTDKVQVDVLPQVSRHTAQLITQGFSPVVRIDRYSNGIAKTRLRAGALIQDMSGVGTLQTGDVLLPFDRKLASAGSNKPPQIRAIDWTYLLVENSSASSLSQLNVVSGYKQPFRTKRNRRNQQLAIRARRTKDESTIRLQSRSKMPTPLIGYEIHEKGSVAAAKTNFVGYTDWRGELKIPVSDQPIRTLLVRSGNRVTAKLPIVPGLRDVVVAAMIDDRQRTETDGFLSGIQTSLIDLVAQRESMSARIRNLISKGELSEAKQLLDKFRDLPTTDDFQSDINRQKRGMNITNQSLQKTVDTMFVQTSRTLGKYLDANRLSELEQELAAASK